ncbi:MAG TPA: MFS transporter [Polyangiaceae bacterium]|nr:MFS transporter [Polyangiaceae bacterium]
MRDATTDRRWALVVAILGSSMAFLDGTVVNVALPVMQRELAIAVDRVQWIVEAYALLLASLVLVGGALGDRYGRKRVFLLGVALFAISSAACGLAPDAATLIVARAAQGTGAALLVPGSLALITGAYDEDGRGKAIGTWSAFSAITSAVGPVAGGWVVEHASWRWLFFFNAPLAAVVAAIAWRRVAEMRDETAPAHLDWPGAALAVSGLGVVTFALVDSGRVRGTSLVGGLLAVGAATLIAFVVVEARSRGPMVPLALFRSRTFTGANLLTLLLYAGLGGAFFFVPFDLIQVQGYSPTAAGAALLPFVLILSAMSRWTGGLAARLGSRMLLVAGPLVAAGGFALLAVPGTGGTYWATFFPAIVVLGLGMGITVAPLTATVMGAVDPRHAGVASGINNAVARAAGLLAIAALGVVLIARFDAALDRELASMALAQDVLALVQEQRSKLAAADVPAALHGAFVGAYLVGFRTVMIASAVLASLGAACAFLLVERSTP